MMMQDEYGKLDDDGQTAVVDAFTFDTGQVLRDIQCRYKTWGELNEECNNCIVVCHALTGNADAGTWWKEIIGPNMALDTRTFFVFCSNVLGGCYGTTGPSSTDPATGQRYGRSFPRVTIRDMVRLQAEVLLRLGVREVACVIGGSMGGMQALEWGLEVKAPRVLSVAPLCASGRHHPWQIGISECQRQAIMSDPLWKNGCYAPEAPPVSGLAIARMMAVVTYRTHPAYKTKFGRQIVQSQRQRIFDVENYLRLQGQKCIQRNFDPMSYVALTEAMDSHDVERGRGSYVEVLRSMAVPVLIVSISSDVLYPVSEQIELAQHIPNAEHHIIQSDEGHDGFLLEHVKLGTLIRGFVLRIVQEQQCKKLMSKL